MDPSSSAVSAIEHHVFVVHGPDRYAVTTEIAARDGRVLLFLDTKHGVDQLTRHLRASGVAAALHSGSRGRSAPGPWPSSRTGRSPRW